MNAEALPLILKNIYGKENSLGVKCLLEAIERKSLQTQIEMFINMNKNLQRFTRIQDEHYRKLVRFRGLDRESGQTKQHIPRVCSRTSQFWPKL